MTSMPTTVGDGTTRLITQGEFAVGGPRDEIIRTLLGSCVSCCLWDGEQKVGGMNHLLLGGYRMNGANFNNLMGVTEMERLINEILKRGGRKDRLQAKIFGGANMLSGKTDIGQQNVDFVLEFLGQERIPCINQSTGGTQARIIKFWPTTGRVSMRLTQQADPDHVTTPPVPSASSSGASLELF